VGLRPPLPHPLLRPRGGRPLLDSRPVSRGRCPRNLVRASAGRGVDPIVQGRPNMSPTEIDQARRQVREALTEAQDRPALSGTRMTVRELGAIYLSRSGGYTRRSPEPAHAGRIPGSLAPAPHTPDRRSQAGPGDARHGATGEAGDPPACPGSPPARGGPTDRCEGRRPEAAGLSPIVPCSRRRQPGPMQSGWTGLTETHGQRR
jgi:hypothetical protein